MSRFVRFPNEKGDLLGRERVTRTQRTALPGEGRPVLTPENVVAARENVVLKAGNDVFGGGERGSRGGRGAYTGGEAGQ